MTIINAMKNLFICLITSLSLAVQAQNFEGTIRWAYKGEITDPATKQKMEQAQTASKDPNNQGQLSEMEKKMKDPQFQKMMEQNPQLKAQMEKIIDAQKNGGGMESLMPKGFVVKFKDGNSNSKIEGGMMESEILYLKDKDQRYSIHRDAKTFSTLPKAQAKADTGKPDVKVTKTKETAKILNYNCTKYIVESTDSKSIKGTQYIWATTEVKDLDPASFGKLSVGQGQKITHKGIDGMPMRITMKTKEMNITMEVVEITKGKLNGSDFTIPLDFKETKNTGMY